MRLAVTLGCCLLWTLGLAQWGGRAGRVSGGSSGRSRTSGGSANRNSRRSNSRNGYGGLNSASLTGSGSLSGLGGSASRITSSATLGKLTKPTLLSGNDLMQMLQGRSKLDMDKLDDSNPIGKALKEAVKVLVKRSIYRQIQREKRRKSRNGKTKKESRERKRVADRPQRNKRAISRSELRFSGNIPDYMKEALKSLRLKIRSVREDKNGDKHYRLDLLFKGMIVLGGELEYSEFLSGEIQTSSFPEDRIRGGGGGSSGSSGSKRRFSKTQSDSIRGSLDTGLKFKLPNMKSFNREKLSGGFQSKYLAQKKTAGADLGFAFNEKRTKQRYVILIDEANEEQPVRVALEAKMLGANADRSGAERPFVLLDPESGDVIRQYDALASTELGAGAGGNHKVGKKEYQVSDDLGLRLTRDGDSCFYETDYVVTYKLEGEGADKDYPYSIPCGQEEKEEINGGFGPINDAHLNIDSTCAFFYNRYGERPLGKDKVVEILVQGAEEDNAHWDGKSLNLNTGKDLFYPLVSADVAAHELGHGILEVNSNLEYKNESGGLNEAFSDMTGKIAETYIIGAEEPENWKIGDEIYKEENTALRYMDNPTLDGKSIDHYADYTDGMDVHYSSGIMNKAFVLISQKPSFSMWEAYDMFFVANWYYWRSTSTFADGAAGSLRAMCNLKEGKLLGYDYAHISLDEAIAAFEEVGISCVAADDCKYQCQKMAKSE